MDDIQSVLFKILLKLVAYSYYIIIVILRAAVAGAYIFVEAGRGVGLALMGMYNEYLRLALFKLYGAALLHKLGHIDGVIR